MKLSCQKYLLELLAKRDYFENRLRQKALEKSFPVEDIDLAIDFLKEKKFLDDKRFGTSLVEKYQRLGKSKNYVVGNLLSRGLTSSFVSSLLTNFSESPDLSKLKAKLEQRYKCKFSDWAKLEPTLKYKIQQAIYSRGYQNAGEVLKQLVGEE
jgi:SOS response regulatory protein OraA/RecX